MDIIHIIGIAVIASLLALWFHQAYPQYSIYIVLAAGILILFCCYDGLSQIIKSVESFYRHLGENAVYVKVLLKIVGIAYISEFCSNLCKDVGYGVLSAQVELAGKLTILVCALPILSGLIKVMDKLMEHMIF